ncbi:PREDICTED: leucine-rich repeat flightless-interacting protein 1 isoform X4 [Myotis brandtii]|uniref:leucine-rich repeat flightless-interacting protein 1 isoform X4 n=1 Tax=Myotis brandtii TaxID=109478 RepID=UPI0003BC02EC|nr:PREDICTED: leucine-rich repeat flightless-interacting protein 1 isoform X4 [Myotis brandtii]
MTNPAATQNKEIDCLSPEAQRLAEARLAAKRAARAEAREIRMKELERQQKEIYQVQKKYYGLYTKWGDIEQWMEDSERCSRRSRRNTSASDEDERVSVGSRGSLRSQPDLESGGPYGWTNGYDGELYGSQPLSRRSGRNSTYSGDGRSSTVSSSREEKLGPSCSDLGLPRGGLAPQVLFAQSGSRPSCLYSAARPAGSSRPSEHSGHLNSSSRASSRASSARASPVVEERPEKDFTEKGSRNLPGLSAATLASLGGTSSRRGSGDTSISIDTEASIREIKELSELKDQIQDVEGKYMQGLKQMKDSLAEVEEKYKKAMVSNAQLDNEKMNYMYQVDTLKDTLLELEEQLAESRRQYEEKSKEFEREKHTHSLLQFQFAQVKAALQQREEMLEEIRQLQQKQASYIREISDLQETIEWKDKKIGALERQKEFFDSIRSERDDLREEVVVLKEELKKHGIILNSETATNGETSDTLNSVGYPGPTKMTKEELNALKVTGDGTLGKATAVEVKNEIVENVGKREILQNTEQEQHKEDPVEDCVDTEALPPGGSAEDRKTSEDSAPSLGTIATNEGQVRSPVLESTSFLEHAEQVESRELTSTPDARTGAPLEQSKSSSEPDGETLGPATGQGSQNAVDVKNQSEEAAEKQEQEEQDVQTSLGEVSTKPHQESAPVQIPEVEKVSSSQGAVEAGLAGLEEQAGTVASRPPRYSDDTGSHDTCAVDVPTELGPGLEKELTNQEGAEPREVQVPSTGAGGEHSEEEDEGRGFLSEKPVQTEVPASPSSPAARAQEAAGAHTVKAKREPSEEKNDPQGEGLGSSQKKTKNKKKKNKKKKSPAPVETPKDVKKELTFQNPDLSEAEEEKQVKSPDENSGVETQNEVTGNPNEVTGNPKQSIVAGSGDNLGFPEDPQVELAGKLNHEDGHVNAEAGKGRADGELFEGDTIQASGCRARAEGSEEGAVKADAEGAGTAPSRPPENEDLPSSARLGNGSPSEDINAASQTEGTEGCVMSEGPSQGVRKVLGSASLENDDLAPARESGDSHSERKEETRGRSEKDKSKEDCALS